MWFPEHPEVCSCLSRPWLPHFTTRQSDWPWSTFILSSGMAKPLGGPEQGPAQLGLSLLPQNGGLRVWGYTQCSSQGSSLGAGMRAGGRLRAWHIPVRAYLSALKHRAPPRHPSPAPPHRASESQSNLLEGRAGAFSGWRWRKHSTTH